MDLRVTTSTTQNILKGPKISEKRKLHLPFLCMYQVSYNVDLYQKASQEQPIFTYMYRRKLHLSFLHMCIAL